MEQLQPNKTGNSVGRYAIFSLALGMFSIMSCSSPPVQLLLGSGAILLAYLSKDGKPFHKAAILGMILGILAIFSSFLMFFNFLFVLKLLDDPSYAALFRQILSQYQEMLNGTQIPQ